MSRRHLALEIIGPRLRVTDLGSTNGTRVDHLQVHKILLGGGETVQIKIKTNSVASNVRNVAADIVKMEPAVKAASAEAVPVVISADKSIKYETVVKVMDTLQKAGVSRVGLSVQTGK